MFLDAERDPGRRASVSQYLQAVHGSAANDVLLDGLKRFASDSNVAPHYRDAIARNMDAGGAAIIAERFHDDATPFEERSYLLGAIARVNSESSVPVLATMLTDERLNGSQVHVMAALASIGSCSSVDTLVRYAETIPADTANPVFNVLASLKVKGDAHASLARHFTTTTHPETKRAIAQALSSAGESAGQ